MTNKPYKSVLTSGIFVIASVSEKYTFEGNRLLTVRLLRPYHLS
jgi:hypothetical protein